MLTIDELTIIHMYFVNNPERIAVIEQLRDSLPHVPEPEIQELMKSAIRKINAMTEEAYNNIDFSFILSSEEAEF